MASSYLFLSIYFIFTILGVVATHSLPSPSCHDDERSYLLEFMKSFNSSWKPKDDNLNCCSWVDLVECDEVTGNVISLAVEGELVGSIGSNSSIFRLVHLQHLNLYLNNFRHSKIPKSITKLTSLELLRISSCNISGIIPSFLGKLTKLRHLDLSFNALIGDIPMSLMNMTQLETFNLGGNNLRGPYNFSALFGNMKNLNVLKLFSTDLSSLATQDSKYLTLPSLKFLVLSSCKLNTFPTFLHRLRNLEHLFMASNNFSGQIPEKFMSTGVKSLQVLYLSGNSLTGFSGKYKHLPLPWSNIFYLDISYNLFEGSLPIPQPNISYYVVNNNKFSGSISPYLCNLTNTLILDISFNNLSGIIPDCMKNIANSVEALIIKNNSFVGRIPELWERGCHNMAAIDLSLNQLQETMPKSLASCKNLKYISFRRNNLTGYIPSLFGSLPNLEVIDLSQNQLIGELPKSLASCSKLEFLSLRNNQLNDLFPSWLGHLPHLKLLSLSSNMFHGKVRINHAASTFRQLQIFDISVNNFVGELPLELFKGLDAMKVVQQSNLTLFYPIVNGYSALGTIEISNKGGFLDYVKVPNALIVLDCSSNRFVGKIPDVLFDLQGLRVLNLSRNMLTGSISSSIKNLSVMESFDISRNKFSGSIPEELTHIDTIEVMDLGLNQFSGSLPTGDHFDTLVKENVGLCGEPLLKKCSSEISQTWEEGSESSGGIPWNFIMVGIGTGTVIGLSLKYLLSALLT